MDENSKIFDKPRKAKISQNGPVDLSLGPPGNYRLHQVRHFFQEMLWIRLGDMFLKIFIMFLIGVTF